jgi:Ni,Fe-hydrogenase III small subunit
VVAVGDCGRDGGIFGSSYASLGGVGTVVPVDVVVPGCPPTPVDLLQGILAAVESDRRGGDRPGRPGQPGQPAA